MQEGEKTGGSRREMRRRSRLDDIDDLTVREDNKRSCRICRDDDGLMCDLQNQERKC